MTYHICFELQYSTYLPLIIVYVNVIPLMIYFVNVLYLLLNSICNLTYDLYVYKMKDCNVH